MPESRVLVVDDDEANRKFVERLLTSEGYSVVSAADGPDALSIVEQQGPFDLFVLDVMMPQMNGDELARRLRRGNPDAKILYFTAYADKLFERRLMLWDREAFLEKPVTINGLLEAVSLMMTGCIDSRRRTH